MTTAVTTVPPSPTVVRPRPRPRLRRIGYEPWTSEPAGTPRRPPPVDTSSISVRPVPAPVVAPSTDPPGAREAVTHVLRLACEVLDGRRPSAHLACHVDASVLRYWRAAASGRRVRSRARFRRVRITYPHPGAAEVAVAVELDGRVRALAARFDRAGPHWRWTAARLG